MAKKEKPTGYIGVSEAAGLLGKSERQVRRMCDNGRVPGAKKVLDQWVLPSKNIEHNGKITCHESSVSPCTSQKTRGFLMLGEEEMEEELKTISERFKGLGELYGLLGPGTFQPETPEGRKSLVSYMRELKFHTDQVFDKINLKMSTCNVN